MYSSLREKINFMGEFDLIIRPWNAEQSDDLKPLILKVLGDLRGYQQKDAPIIDAIIDLISVKWDEYKDMVLHAIYITFERDNKQVDINGTQMLLFTEEDMKQEIQAPTVVEFINKAFELNFSKNRLGGSKLTLQQIEDTARGAAKSSEEMIENVVDRMMKERDSQSGKNAQS